jgi:cation diffusion facilitator family transporter
MAASEKQRVALVSLAASAVLAGSKLIAALATGSLGILSEAIHSLLDFGATIITLLAVRWSDQPPDAEHHYGHAKVESVAALAETGLLFLTTVWIVYEAVHRILSGETHVVTTWWAVAIIAASVIIDYNRSKSLSRVAKKTSSDALAADALHFSSDMWSSLVVLVGLGAVWLGFPLADPIAALVVSFFVALAGWRLGRRTLNTLLDTAPEGVSETMARLITSMEGVLNLRRLRLRPAGATLFAGVVVDVPRTMAVDGVVALKQALTQRIKAQYPNADVTITTNPVALDDETIFQRVMLIAARHELAIHHVTVQEIASKIAISFDVEVDGAVGLGIAHDKATALEAAIRRELGPDVEVESHIEPLPEATLPGNEVAESECAPIVAALREFASRQPRLTDLHNIRVRRNEHGLFVHYHCRFRPEETVEAAHDAVDDIEHRLRERFPDIRRVIGHAEPVGARPHDE